jgi:outer membrane protein assembly factor BamB
MRHRLSVVAALILCASSLAGRRAPDDRWPSFRGPSASGIADGQHLPDSWNTDTGEHVRWRMPIPGLAHSSPIVWGNRIYLTTAVSSRPDATFKRGLYGEGTASEDRSVQEWRVLAVDRLTGRLLWSRVAYRGEPREKRHIKSTYANQTPATDGRHVVAFFGSHGLYTYDTDGRLLWSADLGVLNAGAYDLPEYEWGNASSPIIDDGRVIVQCDVQHGSFVQAFDVQTGRSLWKTTRDELPWWATPTVVDGPRGRELITNAPNRIRGYDPSTGTQLWELGGSSKITAPTPILAGHLVIVASGRGPERPIFAIRPGSRGDLTLPAGQASSAAIAWSRTQRGPYMPTPLAYRGRLYVLSNQGLLDAYDLSTGGEIYRQRLPHRGSGFSASPVAADGRLYLPSEDGDILVVNADETYAQAGTYAMGAPIMATPAIAGGLLIVRTQTDLFAIGR